MVRTFFRKLLIYVSSEDDIDVVLNDKANGQSSGHKRQFHDYFAENSVYPLNLFRRKFRISCPPFLYILNEITAALKMLAYGITRDFMDKYIRIGESTAMESLKKFSETIVSAFSDEYLRSPNFNDIARLLTVAEQWGFPGMLGSIDCMHQKSHP
ncbi:uncharacterized protein LOC122278426 [Carya illinoinensis]|uniref:uncharacterized protein LOC122278426 n=1 Tax=Carya illinoinensis TaxID=32201 RepID=UPI001C71CFB4|nr:uncharacterized protein LOC122278426 [Carya illinoinensis]